MWLGGLWHLVAVLVDAGPAGAPTAQLVSAAALLLAAAFAVRVLPGRDTGRGDGHEPAARHRALTGQAGVPRHRDPDAAGRSRPRAPTRATLAVA